MYPDLFGIIAGKDAIFPAEKCWLIPGQRFTRKLSPADTRKFMDQARWKPTDKIRAIENAIRGPVSIRSIEACSGIDVDLLAVGTGLQNVVVDSKCRYSNRHHACGDMGTGVASSSSRVPR